MKNAEGSKETVREAEWWRFEGEDVRCMLCPHVCLISPGTAGRCGVRIHVKGEGLRLSNYGMAASLAADPIEKKPLSLEAGNFGTVPRVRRVFDALSLLSELAACGVFSVGFIAEDSP